MYNNMLEDAIYNNRFNMVKIAFEKGAKPNQIIIDYAAGMGYLNMIEWFSDQKILPTQYGATAAQILGKYDMVKFLANKQILPFSSSAEEGKNISINRKVDLYGRFYVDINIMYEPIT